ncbi:NADH-ubiquinone oxidoreductase-F iron-sulfur binding region domain-containing protein [Enhygromyxa salina]|uniref:NADH-quinone oxidoreductase subunit F n=1 Tax=Enhygromyxa salina TaxID=215803 RepID=A0A2S9YYK5_9BACT|nr:NADH-ubiquinone oxidoreductase-F iron-sulfur binding region domain-containing protein [Enhygromyxa salina]PRQ10152.1 NADH-quinone oxidoreductase subunit F [Enhygromyxa salina]
MEKKGAQRSRIIELLEEHGGMRPGAAREVARETGVPEADIFGVASFYTLLARPGARTRVCQGLTCMMAGADRRMQELRDSGVEVEPVSCLGQCDRAPAALDDKLELVAGPRGAISPARDDQAMQLAAEDDASYAALARAVEAGPQWVIDELKTAGLQGRGGAGFPAHFKWNSVRTQQEPVRYVVVNADEAEPATFKDREVMLRRPHLMLEGMAIAAFVAGAKTAFIYVRGEFKDCRRALDRAIEQAKPHLDELIGGLEIRIVEGHGAYICGEETALLEAIEGRRGMPRLKPPYPTEAGLWGKPTLMNNVETLACVPSIVRRGGAWFHALGRTEPGSKLYCISGHVARPGVYELPLGVTLDELVEEAGGYLGTPRAFSPGGASSGFLPMSERAVPLDFGALAKLGSMMGSAGVVVLNDTIDMAQAARWQQIFFEDESCGQCAPCRIGARVQRQAVDRWIDGKNRSGLAQVEEVAWEMNEGSICGLGMVASLPLQSAMKYFSEDFQ